MDVGTETEAKAMPARGLPNGKYQGMNWIRPERRLAVYLRDGLACVYCGATVEDGTRLTLDHVLPHSLGGGNETGNLVTSCSRCNSSRGDRSVHEFSKAVAVYLNHGVAAQEIETHVLGCLDREVDVAEAKAIIARRGGFRAALSA